MKRLGTVIFIMTTFFIQAGLIEAFEVVPNVAKDPPEVPPSRVGNVTIDLEATEVLAEIAPGKMAWIWTFALKGTKPTVPGPMIRVREGNKVTINLTNRISSVEPHNIDLHAAMGPGGGASVTNVMPGETKQLIFKALKQGAYIYHCAGEGMPWEHVSYGMYGLIQVDPPGGLPPGFKEFYIGQSDWYLKIDEELNSEKGLPVGTYTLDEERAMDERPTMYSFNGHSAALTDPSLFGEAIVANQNSKVRFFVVAGGPNKGSNWHIIGQIFDKAYTGSIKTPVENEETVFIAPGSAAVFELTALVPGKYLLVDHALWRVPQGAAGFMHVLAHNPTKLDSHGNIIDIGSWPLDIFAPPTTSSGH